MDILHKLNLYFWGMQMDPIVIIGAGPSGLIAAEHLAKKGHVVHIYDHHKAPARKFLVAGHGGFNLTHSEDIEQFVTRYDKNQLHEIIKNFDNNQTIQWLHDLGIPTYIGSSGKIFPNKEIKPIQVLSAWLKKLDALHVKIFYQHEFINFKNNEVILAHKGEILNIKFTRLILALGGGSWSKTGSDAKWIHIFEAKNIKITTLSAANSGYNTQNNYQELEGQNLKNIEVKFQDVKKKGEVVFTNYGIEGSPIYFMNRFTRKYSFPTTIFIDLKPALEIENIQQQLALSKNITKTLKEKLKFNNTTIALLKKLPKEVFTNSSLLSENIKNYPITVTELRPIEEAISTAGGVSFNELSPHLSLIKYPNIYCIGEMVDWEAPTGGYLLQACFSMGIFAAQHIDHSIHNR